MSNMPKYHFQEQWTADVLEERSTTRRCRTCEADTPGIIFVMDDVTAIDPDTTEEWFCCEKAHVWRLDFDPSGPDE